MAQLAVFIPVLDEEAILAGNCRRLMSYLDELGLDFELVLGLNGCTDASANLAAGLAAGDPRVKVAQVDRAGPGLALAAALPQITAPVLITLDMDLSTELGFIPRALELLATHTAVVGCKRQRRQERTVFRVAASGGYIACARWLLGMPYDDYSLGSKAFRTDFVRHHAHLIDGHTAYVGNLVFAAHHQGLAVAKIPVRCSDRRRSRFNLGHEGVYRLAWLGRLFWRHRLLRRPVGR